MDYIQHMPPELLFRILREFDRKEAFKLRSVCRQWNDLVSANARLFPKIPCRTLEITQRSSILIDGRPAYSEPRSRKRKYRTEKSTFAEQVQCPSERFFTFLRQCLQNYKVDTLSFIELSLDDAYLSNLTRTLRHQYIETLDMAFVNMDTVCPNEFYKFVAGLRVRHLTLNWLRNAHHQLLNDAFFKHIFGRINCLQIGHVSYENSNDAFMIEENVVRQAARTKHFRMDVTVDEDNVDLMHRFFTVSYKPTSPLFTLSYKPMDPALGDRQPSRRGTALLHRLLHRSRTGPETGDPLQTVLDEIETTSPEPDELHRPEDSQISIEPK
uniref:F-box domain-containing protein n=1 Tax=Steinernema glaseri TaxID=37863 RepID=A0A1I7Z3H1_9BILA